MDFCRVCPPGAGCKGLITCFFEVLLPFFSGFNLRDGALLRFLGSIALRGAKDADKRVYKAAPPDFERDVFAMA